MQVTANVFKRGLVLVPGGIRPLKPEGSPRLKGGEPLRLSI
jgi:hypothetical protein